MHESQLINRARLAIRRRISWLASTVRFTVQNHVSRRAVTSPGGASAVVIATHGSRANWAFLTLESIAAGEVRPRRLILQFDGDRLPRNLRRLVRRGLEIGPNEPRLGPHNKYVHYVTRPDADLLHLVTGDDDVFYARSWLKLLESAPDATDRTISAMHVRDYRFEHDELAPFALWPLHVGAGYVEPAFFIGIGGVRYPPSAVRQLRDLGEAFLQVCPRADDIWLNRLAVRGRYRVFCPVEHSHEAYTPRYLAQRNGLFLDENRDDGNDSQLKATYTPRDVDVLKRQLASGRPATR